MEESTKVHVGLDVHKDSITIGAAEPGRAPARVIGKTAHDVNKLLKVLVKLGRPEQLHIVYEAGPTGYGLQRALQARGYLCEVIAPSQMPRRPGDRVKTDGRDCVQLAECSRAGQLRAVWVPDPADEAIRDLSRAREDAVNSRTKARQQLKGFLLRHGVRYTGKTSWTKAFYRWLATLSFGAGASQTAFTEYWLAVQAADDRVQRLTQALQPSIAGWRFEPVVAALQALRGIDVISAIGLAPDTCLEAIVPRRLGQQSAGVRIAGLGDAAAADPLAAGALRWDQPEVAHEFARVIEAVEIADLGHQADGSEHVHPAQRE